MSSSAVDLTDWYAQQYRDATNVVGLEGGPEFQKHINAFPVASNMFGDQVKHSSRDRMAKFIELKMRYPFEEEGYTCLALGWSIGEDRSHYAFVYWPRSEIKSATPVPEYVCVCPCYESMDGEYRNRFVRYEAFSKGYEEQLEGLAPYEEAAFAMIDSNRIELYDDVYPLSDMSCVLRAPCNTRLAIQTLAVALALDLWRFNLPYHTSPPYIRTVEQIRKWYPKLLDATQIDADMFVFGTNVDSFETVQCGQKIIPLRVREIYQAGDLTLSTWRELEITRRAGDLVLNFIAPGFPHFGQWSFIEDTNRDLFENPSMGKRYEYSNAIRVTTNMLREARQTITDLDSGVNRGFDAKINESIEYAQSYLLLTSSALLMTMEHVGFPLASYPMIRRRDTGSFPSMLNIFMNLEMIAKMLFDWCYGAHCLHTKLGVVHADLHANNLTVYNWGQGEWIVRKPDQPDTYERFYIFPRALFITGPRGEADTYMFSATGTSGCIIDYSRSLIGPSFRPELERGRSAQYASNFYTDQVERVVATLIRYAPTFAPQESRLRDVVVTRLDVVFPVLAAVDFMAIARSVREVMLANYGIRKNDDNHDFPIDVQGLELTAMLYDFAREFLVTGLKEIIEAGPESRAEPRAFPGFAMFEEIFATWSFTNLVATDPHLIRHAEVVDVFNYNNELRWSGRDYAQFPPWARLDEIEKHLGEYKMSDIIGIDPEIFLHRLRGPARAELLAEEALAQESLATGAAAWRASSWM